MCTSTGQHFCSSWAETSAPITCRVFLLVPPGECEANSTPAVVPGKAHIPFDAGLVINSTERAGMGTGRSKISACIYTERLRPRSRRKVKIHLLLTMATDGFTRAKWIANKYKQQHLCILFHIFNWSAFKLSIMVNYCLSFIISLSAWLCLDVMSALNTGTGLSVSATTRSCHFSCAAPSYFSRERASLTAIIYSK